MEESKSPKKPIIFYYLVTLVVVILLNAFVFPAMLRRQIIEVDYGTFL